MKDILHVKVALDNISGIKDAEKLRFNLYSCYAAILLSTDLFSLNIDTKPFLRKIDLDFKDYVFVSRTTIVGMVNRRIQDAEMEELLKMRDAAIKLVFNTDLNASRKNINSKNKTNKIDSILEQFGE
ncbi:hypothetical protein [Bacillus mycoides]|uniref:hypothetical protein n=1 Tax=Bacillus mycoides TaxID=1405 RepID=UPI0024BD7DE8|nr:hypothetical protein [Bacillus mycoides]